MRLWTFQNTSKPVELSGSMIHAPVRYERHPGIEVPIWSWGVEAATDALRIIGPGGFDAFPKAILILGHLGESLP
jgi:2,3-dihydroxybenzoate decarboxylase